MEITQENLDALRVTFSDAFQQAYDSTSTPLLDSITIEVGSGGPSNTYGWIAQQVTMREWLGPRIIQALAEHSYTLANRKFEATVGMDLDDVEDDNLGIYKSIHLPQIGVAAKKYPEKMIAATLLGVKFDNFGSAAVPKAFDGKNLFANDHPCFDDAGSTYDNDLDYDLTEEGLKAAIQAMASIRGEDGAPFGANATHLIVPKALEWRAKELVQAGSLVRTQLQGATGVAMTTVENMLKGALTVVVSDWLDSAPTKWYLADCSKVLRPTLLQVRRPVEFTSRDQLESDNVFHSRKAEYGAFWRGNAGVTLPHLIQRNTIPAESSS